MTRQDEESEAEQDAQLVDRLVKQMMAHTDRVLDQRAKEPVEREDLQRVIEVLCHAEER